ncbi:MAG: alkaline phosphatase family protein [Bacilli bacterium]
MIKITKKSNIEISYSIIQNNHLFTMYPVNKEIIIDTINDLPIIEELLIKDDYYFSDFGKRDGRYIYQNNNNEFAIVYINNRHYTISYLELLHENNKFDYNNNFELYVSIIDDYINEKYNIKNFELKKPNFDNCLVNLASSFQKKFGNKSKYKSIKLVDDLIKDYNKVTLLLLDGLGVNILNNLSKQGILNKNKIDTISSIFPPTTVAATTCLQSGVLPGESGWIGWYQYFKSVDKNIVLFKNEDYYTGELLDDNIVSDNINYTPYYDSFKKCYKLMPHFMENGFESFSSLIDEIITISNKKDEQSFTYAYWDAPDNLIHEYGCFSNEVTMKLEEIQKDLEKLETDLSEDSCVIIIADHGLVDVLEIHFHNFLSLKELCTLKPSIEGRSCSFTVKDKERFKVEFNKYFSCYFDLYTKDEFLKSGLIGDDVSKGQDFIGDYMAIAKSDYYINPKNEAGRFKAAHAGLTKDEMDVPLIFIKKKTV